MQFGFRKKSLVVRAENGLGVTFEVPSEDFMINLYDADCVICVYHATRCP